MERTLIVGSGVAASTIAQRLLATRGHPVTMLEAGPRIAMRSRRAWLDHVTTGQDPYRQGKDVNHDVDNEGEGELRLPGSRLWARGGSTLHWGGWCPRLLPEDFALRSSTGHGVDWPISYDDLEPYYCYAEAHLDVAGDSDDAVPPRSRPYPQPRVEHTMVDRVAMAALDQLGYAYGHMPIARRLRSLGRPTCVTTGTCHYCPVGAKFSGDQVLDELESHPAFTLLTGAAVIRLRMRTRARAAGVEYLDTRTGRRQQLDAERIIVCAGAVETPKLLLASTTTDWPHGIGNDHGHVGLHLNTHMRLRAFGWAPHNPRRLAQELDFPTLCSRHFDCPREQARGKLLITIKGPPVDLGRRMAAGVAPHLVDAATTGQSGFLVQGLLEAVPAADGNRVSLAPGTSRFSTPRTRLHFGWSRRSREAAERHVGHLEQVLRHAGYQPNERRLGDRTAGRYAYAARGDHAISTCRMSHSPDAGVVDSSLRVHGTDNIFVCSNAVFPSGGAANPTLTLTALALRLADHLAPDESSDSEASPL